MEVRAQREAFIEQFEEIDTQQLIFIDESGFNLGMSARYGRALSHQRAIGHAPLNRGTRLTMIAAIGVREVKTALYGKWHCDGDIFRQFIEQCLVPVLRVGDIVVMDNLSTHKVEGIETLIESKGASLTYLPPYSPDLNPIELLWSKIKNHIRRLAPRTLTALHSAINASFKAISSTDLEGWFEHCGYCGQ